MLVVAAMLIDVPAVVPSDCTAGCAPRPACDSCRGRFAWTWAVGHDSVLRTYASVTAIVGDVRRVGPVTGSRKALLVQADLGEDGGALSAGVPILVLKVNELHGLLPVGAGLAIKATHVWTSDDSETLGQRYAGPAVEFTIVGHARVAYLFPLRDSRPQGHRVIWGFGIGF